MKKDNRIDKELVLDYQKGNKKALAELVKRWHYIFCKNAFWVVKDASLSKDIAQDSWQIIIGKLDTLQNPASFKSWALRIVYSKSIDALRQQQKQLEKQNELSNEKPQMSDEEDVLIDLKANLLKEIKKLPNHQQIVIRLFYTESYSLKEISKLLNISIGTAKSRLFHARESLKKELKSKTNKTC